jgi:hypothetical protein
LWNSNHKQKKKTKKTKRFFFLFLFQDICSRPQFRLTSSGQPLTTKELPEPIGPGDPSLLAAIGCLSQMPRLLERVAPPEQTFDAANGYTGLFK